MTAPALSIDFETRSAVDIVKAGADVYAEDLSTEVLCMAWAIGDGPVNIWRPFEGDPDPQEALDHIAAGKPVAAWNSAFEEAIWQYVIGRDYPFWPRLKTEQLFDTMAHAYAAALPGALDACAKALGLEAQKDGAGKRVMLQLSKPRKVSDDGSITYWTPADAPDKFAKLYAYCQQDVVVEREIGRRLRPLSATERELWLIDQRINRRGIRIDVNAATYAIGIAKAEQKRLGAMLSDITGGAVKSVTNHPGMLAWVQSRGVAATSVDKPAVREMLDTPGLPADVRAALLLKKEGGRASTAKFTSMLAGVNTDGRARGLFQYHGSTTGRWAGRRIQLQNLVRPKWKATQIGEAIELFGRPDATAAIDLCFGDPMDVLASSTRGMLIPNPGCVFIGGDYSNIEGRVLAWLAGEQWKIDAFLEYDAGRAPDLYIVAYARAFGVDTKTVGAESDERQVGKVTELGCGYQGGVGAWRSMAKNYNVDLAHAAAVAMRAASADAIERAERMRQWMQVEHGMHADLPPEVWRGLRVLVNGWRDPHVAIRNFWKDLEECALSAVQHRGEKFTTQSGKITFSCAKSFLYMKLPSGRLLSYARPSLEYVDDELRGGQKLVVQFYAVKEEKGGGKKGKKRFGKQHGYGGHWAENATQAVARDALAEAVIRLERANYPVVLHVHDEARSEVAEALADKELCERLMGEIPKWATGCPIAVKADIMRRYHK